MRDDEGYECYECGSWVWWDSYDCQRCGTSLYARDEEPQDQRPLDGDYNMGYKTLMLQAEKRKLNLEDVKPEPVTELYIIIHMADDGEWGKNKVTFCNGDQALKSYMLQHPDKKKLKIYKGHEVEVSFDVNIKAK